MLLLVGGQKGGTGKSTLATNISAWLAQRGTSVLLVDTDEQANAWTWAQCRAELQELPSVNCVQAPRRQLDALLRQANDDYEQVVIDAGGRDSGELRSCLLRAHRFIIPIVPSTFDIWTLDTLQALIGRAEQQRSEKLSTKCVINSASTNWRSTVARDASKYIAAEYQFPVMRQHIGRRQIYSDCIHSGKGVVDMLGGYAGKAQEEIDMLCRSIYGARA